MVQRALIGAQTSSHAPETTPEFDNAIPAWHRREAGPENLFMGFNVLNPFDWAKAGLTAGREMAKAPFTVARVMTPAPLEPLFVGFPETMADLPFRGAAAAVDTVSNKVEDWAGRGPADVPTSANSPKFQERRFHERGWTIMEAGPISRSRYCVKPGSQIFAETKFKIKVPEGTDAKAFAAEVANKLRQPWTFYANNGVRDWKEHPGGRVTYNLYPTGFGLSVFETMGVPLPTETGGFRIPVNLERDAHGFAYLQIEPKGDTLEIDGRFAGVTPGGLGHLFGAEGYAFNHLKGESGEASEIPLLGLLLKDGGGLAGMIFQEGYTPLQP